MAISLPTAAMDDLDGNFDDHPSLSASLEDFEEHQTHSPLFNLPSQHSGFKSDPENGSDVDDGRSSSAGAPWSPPGFRRHARGGSRGGGSWFRHDPYGAAQRFDLRPSKSPSRSRQSSPEYLDAVEGDEDLTIPANIPLPSGTDSPAKERSPEPEPVHNGRPTFFDQDKEAYRTPQNNYVRFAIRAEVQHREPFVAFFNYLRCKIDSMTRTKSSTLMTILVSLLSISFLRILFIPPSPPPVPDLVRLSTIAKSFEPLAYYSVNGFPQVIGLQETSVAVWDLGESVKYSNLSTNVMIFETLDKLSKNLETLSNRMSRFFSSIDGDIDDVLHVMMFCRNSLAVLRGQYQSVPRLVFDNIHSLLNQGSLLEYEGNPTPLGTAVISLLGTTSAQRTRNTLVRAFHEFLTVLEDSINDEITVATSLISLFDEVDDEFLTLKRIVAREADVQDRAETDLLSSLWAKILGPRASALRKYEKNRRLLSEVRARTITNKRLVVDHHSRLQTLKVNLETLRHKLVSPLLRRNDTFPAQDCLTVVEEQIRGIDDAHHYLYDARDKQRERRRQMMLDFDSKKGRIHVEPELLDAGR